jgi:DNA-directed RNA polymerase specialized sigma24 family protein
MAKPLSMSDAAHPHIPHAQIDPRWIWLLVERALDWLLGRDHCAETQSAVPQGDALPAGALPAGNERHPDDPAPQAPTIAQLLDETVPELRAAYGLDADAASSARTVARSHDRVLDKVPTYDGKSAFSVWVLDQAREAVAEDVVAELRWGPHGSVRAYCRQHLDAAVARLHQEHFIPDDALLRHLQVQEAERLLDADLAEYDGRLSFPRSIHRVTERDHVERRSLDHVDAWLDGLARLVMDRYIVDQLCTNPASPLAMHNLEWVALRVCRWYRLKPGTMSDPRSGLDTVWSRLLQFVPARWHQRVQDASCEINERILRGLRSFKFQAALNTWRTAIVNNSMVSILRRERKYLGEVPLESRLSREIAEADEPRAGDDLLPIADERQDLELRANLVDARAIVNDVLHALFPDDLRSRDVIARRLAGEEAKAIAADYHVPVAEVHRLFTRFRQACQRRALERPGRAAREVLLGSG